MAEPHADLVIAGARLVATMDDERRELAGGWVAIRDGLVSAVGDGPAPTATDVLDATDCLVTPGLVNTHHHLFQNLTRAYPPMTDKPLFGWLQSLYPLWRSLDTEGAYLSAWVGSGRVGVVRVHHVDRSPLPAPARGGRPAGGRDRGCGRHRRALPPDARVDVAVGEGRRVAARRRGGRRRRHPRRERRGRRPPPRPPPRRHGAGGAGAVLAVQRHRIADGRARPSWPSGSTSACTPTSPRTPRTTRSRSPRSAAGRPTTSSAPGG